LAARTYDQNTLWHDPIILYKNIIQYDYNSSRAHINLGLSYMDKGDLRGAIDEFHIANAINDSFVEAHNDLAVALIESPDREANIPEAIKNLERAIELDPNYYRSYELLAIIYSHTHESEKEKTAKDKAEEIKKKFAP